MIFKRYPSPFIFLDNLLLTKDLIEIVDFIYEQAQEDKWWSLYLATLPLNDKAYDVWKKEMQGKSKPKVTTNSFASKIDAQQTIKKSQDILSGFKPPQ